MRYHGTPAFGLVFIPERSQVYTIFSTSQWLVCVDAPEDKASLDLTIVVPTGLAVAASGHRVSTRTLAAGRRAFTWRQDRAVPTYTFGFVAGRFVDVAGDRRLRFLGDGFSAPELSRIFSETDAMRRFFAERSGVSDIGEYTQALVERTAGQEMAGLSLLPDDYGRRVLADPAAITLGAHELAHQWWGNMVTCRDWRHFWLNEGFATFMAAAYSEQRFGREAYMRDIDAARERYERVRAAGHDRALVFPDWDHPTADDRTLVYQKGAYVLHRLREIIGDRAFWAGIRLYTQRYFGKSVTTPDFERTMQEVADSDLSGFFAEWIDNGRADVR